MELDEGRSEEVAELPEALRVLEPLHGAPEGEAG